MALICIIINVWYEIKFLDHWVSVLQIPDKGFCLTVVNDAG